MVTSENMWGVLSLRQSLVSVVWAWLVCMRFKVLWVCALAFVFTHPHLTEGKVSIHFHCFNSVTGAWRRAVVRLPWLPLLRGCFLWQLGTNPPIITIDLFLTELPHRSGGSLWLIEPLLIHTEMSACPTPPLALPPQPNPWRCLWRRLLF